MVDFRGLTLSTYNLQNEMFTIAKLRNEELILVEYTITNLLEQTY